MSITGNPAASDSTGEQRPPGAVGQSGAMAAAIAAIVKHARETIITENTAPNLGARMYV